MMMEPDKGTKLHGELLRLKQKERTSLDAMTIWQKHQAGRKDLQSLSSVPGMRYSILADVLTVVLIGGFMGLALIYQDWSIGYLGLILGTGCLIFAAVHILLSRDGSL